MRTARAAVRIRSAVEFDPSGRAGVNGVGDHSRSRMPPIRPEIVCASRCMHLVWMLSSLSRAVAAAWLTLLGQIHAVPQVPRSFAAANQLNIGFPCHGNASSRWRLFCPGASHCVKLPSRPISEDEALQNHSLQCSCPARMGLRVTCIDLVPSKARQ